MDEERADLGTHLILDLRFVPGVLDGMDVATWTGLLCDLAAEMNLSVLGVMSHDFGAPGALTVILMLAESHLSVHTWPEFDGAAVDLYHCADLPAHLSADNGHYVARKVGATGFRSRLVERSVPGGAWSVL